MTTAELIARLSEFPPDALVVTWEPERADDFHVRVEHHRGVVTVDADLDAGPVTR